ncbi:putative C6 transcription factor [Hypoxylon sp. NC1633]|nr:putative C6 transcription factor [Hypoxylon sp. NC1633]
MAEPDRRRRRPPVSCVLCRRRKIRCNRESPCSNCVKSKSGNCVYENHISNPLFQPPRETSDLGRLIPAHQEFHHSTPIPTNSACTAATSAVLSHLSRSPPTAPSLTTESTRTSHQSSLDLEYLRSRVRQLEEQLSRANRGSSQSSAPTPASNIETISSKISGTFYIHHEDGSNGQSQAISRSVTHKTRVFGQSHWITGLSLIGEVIALFEPNAGEDISRIADLMQKSKSLARVIKSQRTPSWPSPPSPHLPSKDVADELVDCYLRTVETVYRILHVPTFRRDYEALWVSQDTPNTAFLVQLKLVLAIGAATHDDLFSLRTLAIRWVYEAQTWVSKPELKHRLNHQYLQTNLLLLLAREFVDVSPDLVWISAGSLFRTAIYMGLHKDPARLPKTTAFNTEMRRRLWNTILEVCLQCSLTAGGPPLISLDAFDTEPPENFDDEQLASDSPVPKPEGSFTQSSLAIALRKTFSTRLAITRFLNDHGSQGTYEETLRLDAELRATYRGVLQTLQRYRSSTGARPSQSEIEIVSLIINRYVLSLHIPFFTPALCEAPYAFSRKVIVETSLKIWRTMYPSSTAVALQTHCDTTSSGPQRDLTRLAVCSSGFFRILALQANSLIATELRAQVREEEILGPGIVRQDLLSVLSEAKTWSLRCIEAGETSIKGYFLASVVAAHIEGLMQGLGREELSQFVIRAGLEVGDKCMPLLEEMVARGQPDGMAEELYQTYAAAPSQLLEDWDFEIMDSIFDFGDGEPINWVFNENSQESGLF